MTGQSLAQMDLPTVDDINATRLSRFDTAITEALADTERIDFFRDVVSHYVREFDVPEVDVAAALAAVGQGEEPLLLDESSEFKPEQFKGSRRDRDDDVRPGGSERPRRAAGGDSHLATYRIAVGRRQKVTPRQIVGALANEGGLGREDFGRIDIRGDHSLVDLPAQLSEEVQRKLARTRISGQLIELRPDSGGGSRGEKPRGKDGFGGRDRRGKGGGFKGNDRGHQGGRGRGGWDDDRGGRGGNGRSWGRDDKRR
ncbi:DbpA RNA binding domain-containing protein [Propioniciclava coleopterorum]|uniref:DbpA RNA binding domain-containing protein n=1 Tax=Propioniciclava coleopterorum TaxID=2714937 RepID=UPI001FE57D2A|nr:DbpA RNA binding domain-containing protein [Propioniciclava coleopterorum]